jgi:hypothetical protein
MELIEFVYKEERFRVLMGQKGLVLLPNGTLLLVTSSNGKMILFPQGTIFRDKIQDQDHVLDNTARSIGAALAVKV